jgi:hypothetical protein
MLVMRAILLNILRNKKALSSLLIVVIVIGIVLVAIGAALVYYFLLPTNLKTEEMEFSGFTAVEVGYAFNVSITQSSSYSVTITADKRIIDDVEVTHTENTLRICLKPGINIGNLVKNAEITMPELDRLVLSGASRGTLDGFSSSNQFVLDLSGASFLQMTDVNVGDIEINVSGASTLNGKGSGGDLAAVISGASNVDLGIFSVNDANVNLGGASRAGINLDGRLDAEVSGASTLEYTGEPTLGDINTSGGSTVRRAVTS